MVHGRWLLVNLHCVKRNKFDKHEMDKLVKKEKMLVRTLD